MYTATKDNEVMEIGKLFSSMQSVVFELSEGCTISRLSVGLLPNDCKFYDLKAQWKS